MDRIWGGQSIGLKLNQIKSWAYLKLNLKLNLKPEFKIKFKI